MTTYTQKGSVTVDAFRWTGGVLSSYVLPIWAKRLALQVPGDGTLHVPCRTGVFRANNGDWVVLSPDGGVVIVPNSAFTLLYS